MTTTTTSHGIFAATSPLLVLLNGHVSRPKFGPLPRVPRGLPTYSLRWQFLEVGPVKGGILLRDGVWSGRKQGRAVVVRFNQGFGFGGGGGGGGRDNGATARVVRNLALAIGLTYLTVTGQLGWVLDAIVSIWVLDGVICLIVLYFLHIWAEMVTCQLLVVLIPIVGFGVFLWWAGRDIVQSSCPNCGNDFQVFKSSLNDELQLCPFCSQPFSVVDNKFVRESVKFSNQFTSNREAANEFSPQRKKGKDSSRAVVDVEAEVVDAD